MRGKANILLNLLRYNGNIIVIYVDIMTGEKLTSRTSLIGQFVHQVGGDRVDEVSLFLPTSVT